MKIIYRLFNFLVLSVLTLGNVSLVGATLTTGNTVDPVTAQKQTVSQLFDQVSKIANWSLGLVALIAVFVILYSGFLFMTSGGEEEGTDAAKNYLKYGIIGLIIAALAFSVVTFVNSIFSN
ncbi:hypothetical protein HY061_00165 [Candidatus Azambacteria bacterium]|nr:hypothetical protein [Candidatus Azambacteria bacterium]